MSRSRAFDPLGSRHFAAGSATALFALALWQLSGTAKSSLAVVAPPGEGGPTQVVAWNDLGMHCIDPDFSVFSILPPYNTVQAQLLSGGQLETAGTGWSVTYEAVADPSGSINSTSIGKTDFWEHEQALFGVDLPPDTGLAGNSMPGGANVPQAMHLDPVWQWFVAEGVPVTPIDDGGGHNKYPLFRIVVRDAGGQMVASTVTTVPNSDEMRCDQCHFSGGHPAARPTAGWVFDPDPVLDDRINILALHDDLEGGGPLFQSALSAVGYDPGGLQATLAGGSPILCAACHGSNALPGTGVEGVTPLTQAMHAGHAAVLAADGASLDSVDNRTSCYTCHPGLETKCLRGAMGKAVGPDADYLISCQGCHGTMSDVGDPARVGWFEQPNCQQCHTGTAIDNAGAIRFDSVFEPDGSPHVAANGVFATDPDTPAPGFSLYRFSTGHGGLQCAVCHGSPHAIYPTSQPNDNLQTALIQGHDGTLMECAACHANLEDDELVGPHGMHPATADWAGGKHGDLVEQGGATQCQACHGADGRSTVLSRTHAARTFATEFGAVSLFDGANVSCYLCHNGPTSEAPTTNQRPQVPDLVAAGPTDQPLVVSLGGFDPDGDALQWRVVDQPATGKVGVVGHEATFVADAGFTGVAQFTYAAFDGKADSNLGTVRLEIGPAACSGTIASVGFGCQGSGGFMPYLEATGCPSPGETVTLELTHALGGAQALFAVGTGTQALELLPGCTAWTEPLLLLTQLFPLTGGAPGDGAYQASFPLAPTAPEATLTVQAWVLDPGAFGSLAASNAVVLEVR